VSLDPYVTATERVEKPWGYELIWAATDAYVGKLLHVEAGASLSLQYHEEKRETLHVLDGKIELLIGEDEADLREATVEPGTSIEVRPGTIHRITAVEDADVLEASTTELDDVVRIEDDYGRE
jgi:mannose-6-phosphate isomerase-like protein (cupin superfamily)